MGSLAEPSSVKPCPQVWQSLQPLLPSRGPDYDYWWSFTGLHLAYILDAAGYSLERQYDALLFHYHRVVPYLGPAPASDGSLQWQSVSTLQGPPVEYSWKWNTATSRPDIRYVFEAVDNFSGSPKDPLNQDPSREMLYEIARAYPNVDLAWTNHFLAALFHHDRHRYAQQDASEHITSTILVGAEFVESGLNIKVYFKPRRLDVRDVPLQVYKDAISQVCPVSPAADTLYDFLDNEEEGQLLKPAILAIDCIPAPRSRIKLYFRTPRMRFSTVRAIMTLNDRVPISPAQVKSLRVLMAAITGQPLDYPDDTDWPITPRFKDLVDRSSDKVPLVYPACGCYFDIAPGKKYPNAKICVPLYVYGQEEGKIAHDVAQWMKANGRGKFADSFLETLPYLGDRDRAHDLGGTERQNGKHANGVNGANGANGTHKQMPRGVQSYLSAMFTDNGELEVTTYLVPVYNEDAWIV